MFLSVTHQANTANLTIAVGRENNVAGRFADRISFPVDISQFFFKKKYKLTNLTNNGICIAYSILQTDARLHIYLSSIKKSFTFTSEHARACLKNFLYKKENLMNCL